MSKYIIACGLLHPTMSIVDIRNAISTGQTLSFFRSYDEMQSWLKNEGHLFYESDTIPEIQQATIFSFDDNTGRCFIKFIQHGDGKPFEELYGDFLNSSAETRT